MRKKRKERKGKGRYHKVTIRYISAIRGADTPGPLLTKFGVLVAPHDVIKMSNFCGKVFRNFRSTGAKVPIFQLTLLVIITTVLRYRVACDLKTYPFSFFTVILEHGTAAY